MTFNLCVFIVQDDEGEQEEDEDLVDSAEKDFFHMINANKKKQDAKNAKSNQTNVDVSIGG